MAQSPEYPDLPWMPPKSWTNADRTAVQLVVIHTTEGSAHARSAEDGAAYDQRRTDGTSTHYFHDSDSTIQCVHTADRAHTARSQGNRRGIHHELCGRTTIDWGGTYAQAMLRRAAKQCARDAKKWDIPVRKLTSAQVADGLKGFCGHVEITYAFPADGGTHTDPGPDFPWTQFLDLVRAEMEDGMTTKAEFIEWLEDPAVRRALCTAVVATDGVIAAPADAAPNADGTPNTHWPLAGYIASIRGAAVSARTYSAEARTAIANLKTASAAEIVAALPPELARQVADELAARLAS